MIEKHLLENEQVLASVTISKVTFYSTNKRMIRYEKRFLGERVDFLSYPHIASITLESKHNIRKGIILIIILGIIMVLMRLSPPPFIILILYFRPMLYIFRYLHILGFIIIVIGIALCLHRIAWYQIRATGLSNKDLGSWRITHVEEPEIRKFVRMLEQQITKEM
jgi:hypothetical protein